VTVVKSLRSSDQVAVGDAGRVDGELVVVLRSELARAGVLELHLGSVEEAEVVVSTVIDTADFLLALILAFVELQILVGVGVAGGAAAAGVLLALVGAGAETFVVVVPAVVTADGEVELGALSALSLDFLFLLSGTIDASSVSAKNSLSAVESAKVVVVDTVLGEDVKEYTGTVVAGSNDVRALAVTDQSRTDAFEKTIVIVSLAVRSANRVIVARAIALSRAGLHGQCDLLIAEQNAVAFIGGSGHGADWL
jgi:hypothetical protein